MSGLSRSCYRWPRLMNIVITVAWKSSNRLKFCWLNVICCICQSNELERDIKQKTGGGQVGRPAKNLVGRWLTQAPLRTATVALSFLWRTLLGNGKVILITYRHRATIMPARWRQMEISVTQASNGFIQSVRINRMISPRTLMTWVTPITGYLNFKWFTDRFS